jgi:hypothetical protein
MSAYTDFKSEWLGRRVDYDHVYNWQCVDLILQYVAEKFGLASGVSGNAIDYWYRTSAPLFSKFDKIQATDCHQGDIVVLNGLAGNPYGHIGICDSQDANNVTILEQNGAGGGSGTGRDAIELRAIPKSRIAGILRPKGSGATSAGGTAKVVRQAYVRVAPNLGAALGGSRVLNPGDTFQYQGKVAGQAVGGNNIWYHSTRGNFVWSGNVTG